MNWGTDHGCAAAVSAAWVIPCLWPKKGTHSREQEVERGGEGEGGGSGQEEIDYRGNHLYSSGAVAKRSQFPAKTTRDCLYKKCTKCIEGLLETKFVFDYKGSDVKSGI